MYKFKKTKKKYNGKTHKTKKRYKKKKSKKTKRVKKNNKLYKKSKHNGGVSVGFDLNNKINGLPTVKRLTYDCSL